MYPFFLAPQQGYGVFQVWIFLLPHCFLLGYMSV